MFCVAEFDFHYINMSKCTIRSLLNYDRDLQFLHSKLHKAVMIKLSCIGLCSSLYCIMLSERDSASNVKMHEHGTDCFGYMRF